MSEQLSAITTNGGGYHVQLYGFILDHCIEPGQHCMVDLNGRAGAWKLELALELINCSYGFIPLFSSLTSIKAQVDAYNNAPISYSIEVRRGVQSRKLCSTVCYFCCKGQIPILFLVSKVRPRYSSALQ
ncbi:hypothetical protein C5167_041418 [Papaver somniferum]|nr:hypothetical protein C5167_041418 [Papaver somniferum]